MSTATPNKSSANYDNSATATNESSPMAWKTWPDWVNLVLGAYLALATMWTAGAPAGWFVTLGIVVAVVALWALATASSQVSEWVQVVAGAVVFLAPWLGGFAAAAGAAWSAWIIGIAVIVFAVIGMVQNRNAAK